MTLGATGLQFAHRFLRDHGVEFICMNCFEVVCHVRREEEARPYIDGHLCVSENLFPKRLPRTA